MAEPQELGDPLGEGTLGAGAFAGSRLAGNRLNLDVCMDGCHQFLELFEMRKEEVLQVEFLRLSCNEDLITSTLSTVPSLKGLKSLVLKGGHIRDEIGACQRGTLAYLPPEFGVLSCLGHLDLSFNDFSALPPCITKLTNLHSLLVCHNSLQELPEDFGQLKKLTFFSAMKNQLRGLPQSIGELAVLQTLDLSENALESLPDEMGNLHNCTELDLSGNLLTGIPSTLANLQSLRQLHLHSNLLVTVPASLARLPNLSRLDLQNNRLRTIPPEIQSLPFVHLRGNPLGEPEVPPQPGDSNPKELRRLFLSAGEDSFTVTPEGCKVFLSCGVRFCFPRGAATSSVTIRFQKCSPDPQWVKLRHHDILLSEVLELKPHGIEFQEEVQICLPFVSPRTLREREVIIRTSSGETWSDLRTRVEWKGKQKKRLACCSVPHFSWFLVVSRLVENECRVPQEGVLLFSTVDPNIKVTFPPGVTLETRTVKLQVLPVSVDELQEITNDPETIASPLLCLSQNYTEDFLQPVKIQLPLPPGITGQTLDRSKVHLLHSDCNAQNWNDITDQVVLQFTHLYALFEVTHFSWYWLWCTTKAYIGGIAKEVYKKLRMYQVNFIALQRKKDPEQVLLQCVPKHKVDPVLKKLQDRYRGPEPSDMVEMFEGEQFFAAFERGISIDADRPDCIDGRISFNFFSRLKNVKEIYITSEVDRKSNAVKGQVSFYRGAVPENIPEEVTKRRKGPDSHWLATLPIKLPKQKSQGNEHPDIKNGFSLPPLNLGNAETGYLTQSNLLGIAGRIGADWQTIGLNLGLSYQQIQQIKYNNREDLNTQILDMLFSWAQQNEKNPGCIDKLIDAMKESDRQDIADEIEAIIALGRQKYRESIRRVGLDQESSAEDSAIAMV
ncbi:p53-induced death domain-containing protein 1 [Hemicordylus capensis]|uniref:p53-induced death domain-containing protein 1 n=1 Tax=Hemicordylus capensis TaxID=884348 RepID=UPI0023038E21|nr:p53-induced death domain-containing protein 1 [Hemicordylus capensis]XP_053141550.1 p53-induced death domain-containing protein 1 [Hemicordylus capensis]XP_053141551.1 p53-induced death domain-containing protein 1 [Hemicordylus capensis]XP_053141552.1 p53-induced death domain-containing protein 1 [Hemicordylus capensis]XP_053141553.1 p53-induced death domain-containing protein 1 [Hemicordylus capensis]XP_053141554.1 p53-induced death domain-containing protein 1 [Hemicordylus capensis]XP_05